MFITKKKYEQNIREAVEKAMRERDSEMRVQNKFNCLESDMNIRFDQVNLKLRELEKKVFPFKESFHCCDDVTASV